MQNNKISFFKSWTILTTQPCTTSKQYIKKKKEWAWTKKIHTIFQENSWAPESGFPKSKNDYPRRWLEGVKRVGGLVMHATANGVAFKPPMPNTLFALQLQRHFLFRWSTGENAAVSVFSPAPISPLIDKVVASMFVTEFLGYNIQGVRRRNFKRRRFTSKRRRFNGK